MNVCALCLTAALSLSQPPTEPDLPTPTPIVLPAAPLAPAPVVRPITLAEFAATFQPLPGTYEITFIHPRKKCPVCVTFTLPPGCPKMCVSKHDIVFDYGKCAVDIRFRFFGKVSVTTN